MNHSVISRYQEMIGLSDNEITRYSRLANRYSLLRLFALVLGGVIIWQTFEYEKIWLTELAFFLLIVVFAWLVSRQSRYDKKKQFYISLKKVNENEISSINTQENIYPDGSLFAEEQHPYSSDLDIFGKASLFKLLNRSATFPGNQKLAGWLLQPAGNAEIRERQAAAKELSSKLDWKMKFQSVLLFANNNTGNSDVQGLIKYLELIHDKRKSWIKVYIKAVPWVFLTATVLAYFYPPLLLFLFIPGLINIALVLSRQPDVNRVERTIGKAGNTLAFYSDAFKMLEEEQWSSPLCQKLQDELKSSDNKRLSEQVKGLSVLLNRLEYRLNVFIGPVLNVTMAWDVRQLLAIETWKSENRLLVAKAFDVLATVESLISIAGIHINYPEWCFPELVDHDHYTLCVKSAGHPLIPVDKRIENDFYLENNHNIDIITGSNMAGKSTFLRTLGINAVLAFCGAPVCAVEMRITNMKIFTYMRIKDSLNESISTFKAELNRLQQLLDALRTGDKVYFLIDEMLRGTNSADKYRGSKAIIEKLIGQKAVGIVATHDLQIAELEEKYPEYIRNFYFDIQVQGSEMHFDYKLKHGACKTFNASLLLRQLGIEIPGDH
ncbi:MutS-like protein [Arcticibacter tournemirensis]|uniref:DNA mismatch repair protein MutS n=1 Tax=Arcticibacter tournemirensis TaxID=699437 RepID=A0A5M9HD65_9SPHI|nr:DNA mismatch repair protein MutS [Arcticibacter tournemirensis]KAA8484409.1 DNA mismatch repair protein MutS [Arcticibacter tournemirensis]TQM49851.1 MutS-like protein [Arcticibacter tournemirensis]